MRFDIITLFPEQVDSFLNTSIIGRARRDGAFEAHIHDLRAFGIGSYKQVDDSPYGGGPGMLIRVDVAVSALRSIVQMPEVSRVPQEKRAVVLTSASGEPYMQQTAETFTMSFEQITILCGHYEGFDDRVKHYITHSLRLGEFVLTGGELASLCIVDSVVRLLPGVLSEGSAQDESWSVDLETGVRHAEYPHYTRPASFEGLEAPEVLTRGNHAAIAAWRRENR